MFLRVFVLKNLIIFIIALFVITYLISISSLRIGSCKCNSNRETLRSEKYGYKKFPHLTQQKLAILVPFRDRFEELLIFVPHMKRFLDNQSIDYHIFILNQIDKFRFNRASLINVGFLEVNKDFDYIAMHDVDLLPINDELKYLYPKYGPLHISSPDLHPRYHYPTFIGGILLINKIHYQNVNGMSNNYWGWGLEDDEFYLRLKEAGLKIHRPENITTGIANTFKHIHDRRFRKRDTSKCYNQRQVTRKRDRKTGINNVKYKLVNVITASIEDAPITILNISLMCNKDQTPWCDCTDYSGNTGSDTKINEKKTEI